MVLHFVCEFKPGSKLMKFQHMQYVTRKEIVKSLNSTSGSVKNEEAAL